MCNVITVRDRWVIAKVASTMNITNLHGCEIGRSDEIKTHNRNMHYFTLAFA